MSTRLYTILLVLVSTVMLGACSANDANLLHERSQASLSDFQNADGSLTPLLKSSYGYVIFPRITNGAIGIGGAYGQGEVYQNGKYVGYASVTQGSVGVQLGGQRYAELIMFRNETTFLNFSHNSLEFDARASAIAASAGAAATADYGKGVLVFTEQEGGLMFQAAIGGQKFKFTPQSPTPRTP